MMRSLIQSLLTCMIGVLVGLVAGGSVVLADTCSPTPQSGCGTPPCTNGNWFSGGKQTRYSSPWPQYVASYTTTFNPYPVWSDSSAWTALENDNSCATEYGCIAQVGYVHEDALSTNALTFLEFTDNQDINYSYYYNNVPENVTASFKVNRYFTGSGYTGSPYGFCFYWAWPNLPQQKQCTGSLYYNGAITWGPDTIDLEGEVLDYNGVTGSHTVGNQSRNVYFSQINWIDQNNTGYTANLTKWFGSVDSPYSQYGSIDGSLSTSYQIIVPSGPSSFYIWDQRCHD